MEWNLALAGVLFSTSSCIFFYFNIPKQQIIHSIALLILQSASHIASKHNNAKEKKNNTKYAAWAAEQIARKYKVI